ncbi:MAG: DUF4339 domain-containing protein [Verrucomicrobia bacterium]|nr:DUF4339 domain-containing protein [Verrucomicrobiota bacterium]
MNFLILRRGQKLGPFPYADVGVMSAQGELRAGDLVRGEGEQDWLPLSRFLELRQQLAATANPPTEGDIAQAAPASASASAPVSSKTAFLRRNVGDTDAASLTEAEREVIAGGRLVAFEYCWSLVVSFKRASAPVLLRAGDDGFGAALRYSLLTVFLGWWGVPGPIWVFTTLRHNARGGRDVTLEALSKQVGHARAAAACARHQTSARPGALLGSLGGMMTALALALWLGIGWLVWAFAHGELGEPAHGPGSKEFDAANTYLVQAKRSSIFGNVTKALELADAFNKGVKESYFALARQNPSVSGLVTNNVAIVTYCELHQDRVIFLVQVPGLHKLPASLRNRFADDVWRSSSIALSDIKAGFIGLRVAVGIRSASKYDQVLVGRYIRDFEANNTGLRSRSLGHRSKSKLYPLFVPLEQLESWQEE